MATSCYRPSMISLSSSSKTSLSKSRARVHLLYNPRRLKCGNLMISNSNYNAALPKSSSSSAPATLLLTARPRRPFSSPSLSLVPPHSSASISAGEEAEAEEEGKNSLESVEITVFQYLMVSIMLPLLLNVNWWVRIGLFHILFPLAILPVVINQKKLDLEMTPMMIEYLDLLRQIKEKKRNNDDDYQNLKKLKDEQYTALFNKYGRFAISNYKGRVLGNLIKNCIRVIYGLYVVIYKF